MISKGLSAQFGQLRAEFWKNQQFRLLKKFGPLQPKEPRKMPVTRSCKGAAETHEDASATQTDATATTGETTTHTWSSGPTTTTTASTTDAAKDAQISVVTAIEQPNSVPDPPKSIAGSRKSERRTRKRELIEELARLKLEEIHAQAELTKARLARMADESSDSDDRESVERESRVREWIEEQQGPPALLAIAENPHQGAPPSHKENRKLTDVEQNRQEYVEEKSIRKMEGSSTVDVAMLANALAQAVRQNNTPSAAPRYVQELPTFTGNTSEWLNYRSSYQSTAKYFSKVENVARLRRSLQFAAKETVSSLLLVDPEPEIIMSTLERRFGRPEIIIMSEMDKMRTAHKLNESPRELCIFACKISNSVATIEALNKREYLYNPEMARVVCEKLTPILRSKWFDYRAGRSDDVPELKKMADFLNIEADKCASYATPERERTTERKNFARPTEKVFHADETRQRGPTTCPLCKDDHTLSRCPTFAEKSVSERWEIVKKMRLCFKCISGSHRKDTCRARPCGVKGCKFSHHRLLHEVQERTERPTITEESAQLALPSPPPEPTIEHVATATTEGKVLLKIAPVVVSGPKGDVDTYCLLDEGSSVTILTEELAEKIGATGPIKPMTVRGISGQKIEAKNSKIVSFNVRGRDQENQMLIRSAKTVPYLNITTQTIKRVDIESCKHLNGIADQLTYDHAVPTMLIGQDNWEYIISRKVKRGRPNQPVASKTRLGWVLHGTSKKIFAESENVCTHAAVEEPTKDFFKPESLNTEPKSMKQDPEPCATEYSEKYIEHLPEGRLPAPLLWTNENEKIAAKYDECQNNEQQNPADDATRPISSKLTTEHRGFCGPEFLRGSEETWPHQPVSLTPSPESETDKMNSHSKPVVPKKNEENFDILSMIYRFFKKVAVVGVVYLVGYMQWSVAWLITPVILSVMRDQWRRESEYRRNMAKAAALSSERDVVLARLHDLPAWVFFPDIERAEWLNRILLQVWPNVNHYARSLLKESIGPAVAESLANYKLSGFKFERMILGTIAPRVGGVKVYDKNLSRDEIIMDVDLFYAGDCDISFVVQGIRAGIKDLQLHGMVRVVMKPLITKIPLVGGLQIFFLNNPSIDFNLVGAADILDMPGFSDILRRCIVEQISKMMVLPNKLPIKLSDEIPTVDLRMPEPEGVLRIHLVQAKNLMKKDISMLGKGKSDPYAIITVGAQQWKTKHIDSDVNPRWDFWCEARIMQSLGQALEIELFDKDEGNDDDKLGRCTLEISQVVRFGRMDTWQTLQEAKHGKVNLRLSWHRLSSDLLDLAHAITETQVLTLQGKNGELSSAVLSVYIDSCKNLPNARLQSRPDPYLTVTVGKKTENTAVQMRTDGPVYEIGYSFLVQNPEIDTLEIKAFDQKTGSQLGQLNYGLVSLLKEKDLSMLLQPLMLQKSGPESKIILSLQLRILKEAVKEVDDEEVDDIIVKEENPVYPAQPEPVPPPPAPSESTTTNETDTASPATELAPMPNADLLRNIVDETPDNASQKSIPVEEIVKEVDIGQTSGAPGGRASPKLVHRISSLTTSAGEAGLGRILLSLRYSMQNQVLYIVVHKIMNIPLKDPNNVPDPYVKLYLLPGRSKDSKRKTVVIKDNCMPEYDEQFEWPIPLAELHSRHVEVTVASHKGFLGGSPVIGQVLVHLNQHDLREAKTLWFDLMPESNAD